MQRKTTSLVSVALALGALGMRGIGLQACATDDPTGKNQGESLRQVQEKMTLETKVSVTVVLQKGLSPEALRAAQDAVEGELTDPASHVTHKFTLVSGMGMVIGSQA